MKTIYRYVVIDAEYQSHKNWDFIRYSGRYYYYDPVYEIEPHFYQGSLSWFDSMRQQILVDDYSFSWDQLTKLPYLYRSLGEERQMRFPISVYNDRVCCGAGRTLIIKMFYPDIVMDRILITDHPLDHPVRINNMYELENILLQKPWFQKNLKPRKRFYWDVRDGIINAHDISRRWSLSFPFCQLSVRNEKLIQTIIDLCKSKPNDSIDSIIHDIALLDIK